MIKKIKHIILVLLKFFLGVNVLMQIANVPELYKLNIHYKKQEEFVKTKVLLDTIILNSVGMSSEAQDDVYKIVYKNPMGSFLLEDNRYSLDVKYTSKKSNIIEIIHYAMQHNDSINIWYHPEFEHSFAYDEHTKYIDSFDMRDIKVKIILLFVALISLLFFIHNFKKK